MKIICSMAELKNHIKGCASLSLQVRELRTTARKFHINLHEHEKLSRCGIFMLFSYFGMTLRMV
jgi:hypothetical protein